MTVGVDTRAPDWLRQVSLWGPQGCSARVSIDEVGDAPGFPWFELACDAVHASEVFDVLAPHCPGLTHAMLHDLLTPDDEPEGVSYGEGDVRLASSFSVTAQRPEQKSERGTPEGVGVLVFQPVELVAGSSWLITCWHPRRAFQGASRIDEEPPGDSGPLRRATARRWQAGQRGTPGDLGVSVMHELALTYVPTGRDLHTWLEDWELSLYLEDAHNNHDQLPELWGLMAVLRKWLSPLNKPGLGDDIDKAWLPASDHAAVVAVDRRIDDALDDLAKLSETLRQSFGLLHLEQTEEQRRHSERLQHRIEAAAAVFLVPTLIVGFYGANTWVPGQGRHWGFWVMVVVMVLLSLSALFAVLHLQRRSTAASQAAARDRDRVRSELLRSS